MGQGEEPREAAWRGRTQAVNTGQSQQASEKATGSGAEAEMGGGRSRQAAEGRGRRGVKAGHVNSSGTTRETAQTAAIVKYAQLVVQWDAARREQAHRAAAYVLRRRREREAAKNAARQARQAAERAAGGSGAREGADEDEQNGSRFLRFSVSIRSRNTGACNTDKEGAGNAERRQSGRKAVGGVGRGQGQRKVAGGNGNRKLGIGVNLVAALQRMEWIGLSWRSIWDKG